MTTIKAFIKRHPLLTYFALAFAISWGGVLIVAGGPGGISANSEASEMQLTFLYPALIVGPSVAGILLTALLYGRVGLRELRSRLLKWRVGARWYAVALLTAPLSVPAVRRRRRARRLQSRGEAEPPTRLRPRKAEHGLLRPPQQRYPIPRH